MSRRRNGLVDLLVARRRVARANHDRGAGVLEAEVVGLGAVLEDAYLVLGVARVRHTLQPCALVGVVARVRDVERLGDVPALGLYTGEKGVYKRFSELCERALVPRVAFASSEPRSWDGCFSRGGYLRTDLIHPTDWKAVFSETELPYLTYLVR